jgi:hypothetical protein
MMGSQMSRTKSHKVISGWDALINSIYRQLQEYEKESARLRVAMEYFEKRKATGDVFPGEDQLRAKGLL